MDGPGLLQTVLGAQQLVEEGCTLVGVRVAGTTDIVELLTQLFCLQTTALGLQELLPLLWVHDSQTIGHLHIVVLIEQRVIVSGPDALELIEHFGR